MPPCIDQLMTIVEPRMQSHPVKSGPVFLHQKIGGQTQKMRVVLSIYSSRFDHYAVLSQERILCKDCGFMNLKHCKAQKVTDSESSFEILSEDGDLGSLMFTPVCDTDVTGWLTAVNTVQEQHSISRKMTTCRFMPGKAAGIPRTPLMPTLSEERLEE